MASSKKTTRAVPVGRPERGGAQRKVVVPAGAGKRATGIGSTSRPTAATAGKGKGKKAGQSALAVGRSYAGGVPVPGGDSGNGGGTGADTAVNLSLPSPAPTPVFGPRYSSEADPGGIIDSIIAPHTSPAPLATVSRPIVGPTSSTPIAGSAKIDSTVASTSQAAGGTLAVAAGAGPKSIAYKPAGAASAPSAPMPTASSGPKSVASKAGTTAPAPAKPLTAQELAKIYG